MEQQVLDRERLTRKQKDANDSEYYKKRIDHYDNTSYYNSNYNGISERTRIQVNLDLYNNKLNMSDLAYVCTPFGDTDIGSMPATMANRDITSNRIKSLVGMEMKRGIGFRVMATNPEATTRKEEEETSRIKDFVIAAIMQPIRQQTELQYEEELKGQLTPQRRQEILAEIEQQVQEQTPDKVRKYMQRKHQDPAEVQGNQIINYLIKEQDIKSKFSKGFLYGMLSAYFLFYVGEHRGKPIVKTLNPKRFSCQRSTDKDYIEDLEWASYEFIMTRSEIIKNFELTPSEIDKIYNNSFQSYEQRVIDSAFTAKEEYEDPQEDGINVLHTQWIGLRKIGWLKYLDENGEEQEKMLVDEEYKKRPELGDISIEWDWIPIVEEGFKIGSDIYKNMGPVSGQHKDINRLYETKLSYKGAIIDNYSAQPVAPMDRMKYSQYLANIIWYRFELLMASDKGKKLLMNINAVPGAIGMKRWQHYLESSPYIWYNPDEEGMTGQDVNTIGKVIDLSLSSDLQKYMDAFEKIDQMCGRAIGITDPVLGQTAISEKVANNQQNLVQTSYILEPYFDLFNRVKKNVLQALLDTAKTAYVDNNIDTLSYVLDDMSMHLFKLDLNLLESSTLGLFMEDSSIAQENKDAVRNLAHAAMQNQTIEMSDILSLIKEESATEAEDNLRAAEDKKFEKTQSMRKMELQNEKEIKEMEKAEKEQEHKWKLEEIRVQEGEKRKTRIAEATLNGLSFNPDKDFDDDGQLDILEVARDGANAQILVREQDRKDKELAFKIADAEEKNKLESRKITTQGAKKTK